jgi:hypothetical protein
VNFWTEQTQLFLLEDAVNREDFNRLEDGLSIVIGELARTAAELSGEDGLGSVASRRAVDAHAAALKALASVRAYRVERYGEEEQLEFALKAL